MLSFLLENLATTLITLALALIVGLVVAGLVRRKRAGGGGCGCGCEGCPNAGACHHR